LKRRGFGLGGALLVAVAAFLAGCSGGALTLAQPGNLTAPAVAMRLPSMTMPHYVQRAVHPDHNKSWLSPSAESSKMLLYVGDDETDDVYVYDYKSGNPVGTLTGFSGPYGECVDAKGDIYIANFDDEDVVEYAHGGTKVLNTYVQSGGTPIGCAVDFKGDVAVTGFDPGEVTVFAGGNPSKGISYSGACTFQWPMGYDNKGNLVGGGENQSGVSEYCGLLANSKGITLLSTSGFPQNSFPGGTTWDGKYFALSDQEAGGEYQSGIIQASLKGTTLTYVGETTFSDDCYSDYTDDVNPFVVGKKNTPVNDKQGNAVVGPNLWCESEGKGGRVDYWHYPPGGMPYKNLSDPSGDPYGAAVSLAE
jgi:hypothetical protein